MREQVCNLLPHFAFPQRQNGNMRLGAEERMRNMFYKIFDSYVDEKFSNFNIHKWFRFNFDTKWDYAAPYVFFSKKETPIILVPILNTDKCTEYVWSHWFYRSHNQKFRTIVSFYDLEQISGKVRWKFLDVVDKSFTYFDNNREDLVEYTLQAVEDF